MITPIQNYNCNTAPSFKSSFPQQLMSREVSMIMSSLSKEAKERIGTTIHREDMKNSLIGRIINFFTKRMIKNSEKGGIFADAVGSKEKIVNDLAEAQVCRMLLAYLAKLFPGKNGKIDFNPESFKGKEGAGCLIGNGYKIHNYGDKFNFELDQTFRKPFVELLEKAQTYKEIETQIEETKPVPFLYSYMKSFKQASINMVNMLNKNK